MTPIWLGRRLSRSSPAVTWRHGSLPSRGLTATTRTRWDGCCGLLRRRAMVYGATVAVKADPCGFPAVQVRSTHMLILPVRDSHSLSETITDARIISTYAASGCEANFAHSKHHNMEDEPWQRELGGELLHSSRLGCDGLVQQCIGNFVQVSKIDQVSIITKSPRCRELSLVLQLYCWKRD